MQIITAIYRYPIKGCAAVPLKEAELDSSGVRDDRRLMLVSPEGSFLSQAKHPRMSLIQASIHGDEVIVNATGVNSHSFSIAERGPDSVVQFWFDGDLLIDHRDVAVRTGAHPDMKIDQFLMAPYFGPGVPNPQKIWIDDLRIYTITEETGEATDINDPDSTWGRIKKQID